MKFTTQDIEKRFIRVRRLSIPLILFGVILIFMADEPERKGISALLNYADSLFIIIMGAYMWFSMSKNLKKVKGSFVEFNDDSISFRSRQQGDDDLKRSEISDIEIRLKTIELVDSTGSEYSIVLEDYKEYKDRVKIKENFESLKKELSG